MKRYRNDLILSASDLVGHLNCGHLTALDFEATKGLLSPPAQWDPVLEILRERGRRHEEAFIEHLRSTEIFVSKIDGVDVTADAVAQTHDAMAQGHDVICQAALQDGRWLGRADVLRRLEVPSDLGDWSYEIIDTKLARETKAGTVLQLCLYADLLEQVQGRAPEYVYVVAPWSDYEPQAFRVADYGAYYRRAKRATEIATDGPDITDVYPDPKEHCDVCRWRERCEQRRRDDDHLCLVAGITKNQITELQANGVDTRAALAAMPIPMPWKPQRGSRISYEKAREQARIQVESEHAGELRYELLPVQPETGLCLLPEPSSGDIFFDIEGDPFVGEHGLEYLFGYQYRAADGSIRYAADWALDRDNEKAIFERFIDFVAERRKRYPGLHIYHFAPYEPGALKRLMGRYASREREVDDLLRGKVFVDLYSVVRNGLRAGVESYSIKKLEPLYGFVRETALPEANKALASVQAGLELADAASIGDEERAVVQQYNADDCASTAALRDWLEARRSELIDSGTAVPRPEPGTEASEELTEREAQVQALIERLTDDIPVDPDERTVEQHARWILAYLLEWHRREEKAAWWEHYRLAGLTADELVDERAALAHLTPIEAVDHTKTGIPTHRYRFEAQDTDLRGDEKLKTVGGEKIGEAVAVSPDDLSNVNYFGRSTTTTLAG